MIGSDSFTSSRRLGPPLHLLEALENNHNKAELATTNPAPVLDLVLQARAGEMNALLKTKPVVQQAAGRGLGLSNLKPRPPGCAYLAVH